MTQSYIRYVLTASAISVIFYIYLLVVKIGDKTPSAKIDWFFMHGVIILQFAVAFLISVMRTNLQRNYDNLMTTLDSGLIDGTELASLLSTFSSTQRILGQQ